MSFLDYDKVALLKKIPSKEEAKNALLEYIETEFEVTAPKNYSFDRIARVAEERIAKKREEEIAMEKLKAAGFKRTNVTPHDIMNGDKSIISYQPKLNLPNVNDEKGEYSAKEVADMDVAPIVPAKLISTHIGATKAKEISVEVSAASSGDVILNDMFRPSFELSMRTPDGRECTTIGYWIIDEIVKLGSMWKIAAHSNKYHQELMSLIYYIQKNGEVVVRESMNSTYIILK
ncbi:MAG: hypothetical protein ACRCWQ_10835 [Bacilli bacterium]